VLTRLFITALAWALLTIGLVVGIWPLALWPLSMVLVAIGVFSWSWDEAVGEERLPGPRRQRSALERVALLVLVGEVFGGGDER